MSQPTGQPSLEDLVKQQYEENQRKAAEASGQAPAIPAASANEGFKMNVGGQEYNFKSVEEMQNFVASTIQTAQQTVAQVQAALPGSRMTADDAAKREVPKPDLKEFARRLDENPADAFNYIDKFRFGTENVPQLIQSMAQQQMAMSQTLAAYQFRDQHPEFDRTPENADALTKVMQGYNLPLTVDGLEMAYAVAKQNNLIKMREAPGGDDFEEGGQVRQPAPRGPATPPRVGRTSGASPAPDWLSYAEDLDPDQLLKVISEVESGKR